MPKLFKAPIETMFLGKDTFQGCMPSLFYFSLSARQSLTLEPYNSLPKLIDQNTFRIFSMTLPMHEEQKPFIDPMSTWIEQINQNNPFLIHFLDQAALIIQKMHENNIIDLRRCALSGLSRGGFVALQLLKRLNIEKAVLFAPFFSFEDISKSMHPAFVPYNLMQDIDILSTKQIEIFIGNQDKMVNTDSSYQFTKLAAKQAERKRTKGSHSLHLRKSIGHKGHGTPPDAFQQGAEWILKNL